MFYLQIYRTLYFIAEVRLILTNSCMNTSWLKAVTSEEFRSSAYTETYMHMHTLSTHAVTSDTTSPLRCSRRVKRGSPFISEKCLVSQKDCEPGLWFHFTRQLEVNSLCPQHPKPFINNISILYTKAVIR